MFAEVTMLADKTKYPELFCDTYWGNCGSNLSVSSRIIDNRNEFVEEYKLKKYVELLPNVVVSEYDTISQLCVVDHGECYVDNNGNYVLISSPYDFYDETYVKHGWIPYNDLYNYHATTYVKVVKSNKSKRKSNKLANKSTKKSAEKSIYKTHKRVCKKKRN